MKAWAPLLCSIILSCIFVAPLRSQSDPRRSVTVYISQQLIHVTLLDPVTAPPGTVGKTMVRARLQNPLLGTAQGYTGTTTMVPAGVQVNLQVSLSPTDHERTNGRLVVQILSANIDPREGQQQLISFDVHHDFSGWPAENVVLIPANSPLSFPVSANAARRMMSQADFAAGANGVASSANPAAPNFGSRPILQRSRVQITLLEPIDASNVGTGKVFHAQLNADMQLPRELIDIGAIKLPRGTEAYVKATEKNPSSPLGHIAELSVDSVVINGHRVPVRTVPWTTSFTPTAAATGRSRIPRQAAPLVLWANGDTKWFDVAEHQEVLDDGTPLSIGPAVNLAAPAAGTQPDPRPQVEERRQQAERTAACQQQAIKDHPQGGIDLRKAIAACIKPN